MKIQKLRAQITTTDANGKKIKRSIANLRSDLAEAETKSLTSSILMLLDHETVQAVDLTAKSSLAL